MPARAERVTSASPAAIPQWTSTGAASVAGVRRSRTSARIRVAARSARGASSSWEVSAPKTAMTASPMNFSTTPPCSSTAAEQIS